MLDDLLNAPARCVVGEVELGLVGIEAAERGREIVFELVEGGIHSVARRLH